MGFSCKFYDTKLQVTSVYSVENTDILEQTMCFDRKDVSFKFDNPNFKKYWKLSV